MNAIPDTVDQLTSLIMRHPAHDGDGQLHDLVCAPASAGTVRPNTIHAAISRVVEEGET